MSEKPSEKSEMSSVAEAKQLVQRIAEPRPVGDSVKCAIIRAARRLGFENARTKTLWYGEARRVDAEEMDRLREIAGRQEARDSIRALLVLRARLASIDPHYHCETIAALEHALRAMGCDEFRLRNTLGSVALPETG